MLSGRFLYEASKKAHKGIFNPVVVPVGLEPTTFTSQA
jgi:hypothetical protein